MGSLAYALGGATAGLGQGLETVGKESLDTLKQAKLEELRAAHQEQMQQEMMKHQTGLQESQQTFQHGEDVYRTEQAVKAASATRAFEAEQNSANRASHEKIGAGHDTARVDSAAVSAYSRSGAKGSGPKAFRTITMPGNPMSKDPIEQQARVITYDPNSDQTWVTIGDRAFRADPNGKPVDRDGKPIQMEALSRPPVGAANDLIGDPTGKVPGSQTLKSDAMLNRYGFVPAGYLSSLQNSRAPTGALSQASGIRLPSGRVFNAPAGGGGQGGDESAPENPEATEGDEPPFQSGANQTYGNVAGQ